MPSPPSPQKRRRRTRKPLGAEGSSGQRRVEESRATSPGILLESDSSSTTSGDDVGELPMYQAILASFLDSLALPPSADGVDPDSVDRPDLPSRETIEALTRSSFLDGESGLRDALDKFEVRRDSNKIYYGSPRRRNRKRFLRKRPQEFLQVDVEQLDSCTAKYFDHFFGEFHSADDGYSLDGFIPYDDSEQLDSSATAVAEDCKGPFSTDYLFEYSESDDIPYEEFVKDSKQLDSRRTPVDEYNTLDLEKINEDEVKRAIYRIKACLLLKGKAIDKLDDAALERKYPRKLILENSYFRNYENHDAFGWYFDANLCKLASLTDYQRLVIFNYWGDQYQDWSRYRSHFNTAETDRAYLLYWETITEKISWIRDCMYVETSSLEWANIRRKASYQAIRIATRFENIHLDLACLGIEEFLWSTRLDVYYLKDLDGIFFEIWERIIKEQNVKDCFKKALKEVYDLKMFPARQQFMEDEQRMAEQFYLCTVGITEKVPAYKARELIAQQVRHKLAMTRGYEHYARKKLKVAKCIGLIGKTST